MQKQNNSKEQKTLIKLRLIKKKSSLICNGYMYFCLEIFFLFVQRAEAIDCNAEPENNEGRLRKFLFCSYDRESAKNYRLDQIDISRYI